MIGTYILFFILGLSSSPVCTYKAYDIKTAPIPYNFTLSSNGSSFQCCLFDSDRSVIHVKIFNWQKKSFKEFIKRQVANELIESGMASRFDVNEVLDQLEKKHPYKIDSVSYYSDLYILEKDKCNSISWVLAYIDYKIQRQIAHPNELFDYKYVIHLLIFYHDLIEKSKQDSSLIIELEPYDENRYLYTKIDIADETIEEQFIDEYYNFHYTIQNQQKAMSFEKASYHYNSMGRFGALILNDPSYECMHDFVRDILQTAEKECDVFITTPIGANHVFINANHNIECLLIDGNKSFFRNKHIIYVNNEQISTLVETPGLGKKASDLFNFCVSLANYHILFSGKFKSIAEKYGLLQIEVALERFLGNFLPRISVVEATVNEVIKTLQRVFQVGEEYNKKHNEQVRDNILKVPGKYISKLEVKGKKLYLKEIYSFPKALDFETKEKSIFDRLKKMNWVKIFG